MGEYKLKSRDIERLKSLMITTSSVYTLYRKLGELEAKGKRKSLEYQRTISYLKMATDLENKEYKYYFSSRRMIKGCLSFLFADLGVVSISSIDDILSINNYDLILKRIITVLDQNDSLDEEDIEYIDDFINNNHTISTSLEDDDEEETIEAEFFSPVDTDEISDWLDKQMVYVYLILLDRCIRSTKDHEVKKNLIKAKYNLLFVCKWLEPELIYKDFNTISIWPDLDCPPLLFNSAMKMYDELKNEYGLETCGPLIVEILEAGYNNETETVQEKTDLILKQLCLKTGFLFVDEINKKELEKDTIYQIANYDYLMSYNCEKLPYNFGKDLVLKAFRKVKGPKSNN
jgi:hypothetical protein